MHFGSCRIGWTVDPILYFFTSNTFFNYFAFFLLVFVWSYFISFSSPLDFSCTNYFLNVLYSLRVFFPKEYSLFCYKELILICIVFYKTILWIYIANRNCLFRYMYVYLLLVVGEYIVIGSFIFFLESKGWCNYWILSSYRYSVKFIHRYSLCLFK